MRSTAREQYAAKLRDSLDSLRAIRARFEQRGDQAPVGTQKELQLWKSEAESIFKKFEGDSTAAAFGAKMNFNGEESSVDYLEKGIETYEELITSVISSVPKGDIRRGYAEDVSAPLEQIDELLERIKDIYQRSSTERHIDYQTAEDGLRRWKDTAYKVLTPLLGEDEAGEIYSMRAGSSWGDLDGSLPEQFAMFVTYLINLKEEIQKYPHHLIATPQVAEGKLPGKNVQDKKVFIVHGHGHMKDAVARAISAVGLEPVVLQEKPGVGRTLIEKFVKFADVEYAVVLLSPDDIGGKPGEEQHDRARQNVVFELGYFVGKLGRGRVCMLYSQGVEIPSDLLGVEYVLFDDNSAWKYKLGQELKEVGFEIDLNAL
jgi:predicted nucleotide-binding protein